jgi:ribosomal protein S6
MKATENKETGDKMHVYEIGYLIMPTVSEEQISAEVASLHDILTSAKAEVIAEGFPNLIQLAYTMVRSIDSKNRKFKEGYFGWIKFELPVAEIANIKTAFDKHPNVLRHLIIKTVRENTMYSTRVAELEGKDADVAETDSVDVSEIKVDDPAVEDGADSQKEIDKSIDALVI